MVATIRARSVFVASLAGALALGAGSLVAASALAESTADPAFPTEEAASGQLPQYVSGKVKGSTETGLFIVQFEQPSLARYRGEPGGLKATSPEVTGARRIDAKHPDTRAYLAHLKMGQQDFVESASQALSRPLRVAHRYLATINGVAMELSHQEAEQLAGMAGVKAVFPDQLKSLASDVSPGQIGAPAIWTAATGPGGGTRGEGVVVGMLGTGVNSLHPAFSATDQDGFIHANPYGPGVYRGYCASTPGFCNDKLIAAYTLHPNGGPPEDTNGYSSHTASLAVGNRHEATFNVGAQTYTFDLRGVAPRANLVAYRICDPSCPNSAIIAAVESAILNDAVDVLNYPISGVDDPWVDVTDLALLDATAAGILVVAMGGNSGPAPGTIAKTGPWNASTADATIDRLIANTLDVTAPATPPTLQGIAAVPGDNSAIAGDLEQELRFDPGNALGCTPFAAGFFTGSIALVQRGGCTFATKASNAEAAGAVAVLVVNSVGGPPVPAGGVSGTPPVFMVSLLEGSDLRDFLLANPGTTVRLSAETALVVRDDWKNILSGTSARGPGRFEVLKPDFTAPGVNLLGAGAQDAGDPDRWIFQNGSGQASAVGSGAAALMRALHPGWTPAEIKSALVTTARKVILNQDGATPATPFGAGSGLLALDAAATVGLVLNETGPNYLAANPDTGGDPKTLNQPSLVDYACRETCTWTRIVRSVLNESATYSASFSGPAGLSVTVNPSTFTIAPGATRLLTITADVSGLPDGEFAFGELLLSTNAQWRDANSDTRIFSRNFPQTIPDNAYDGSLESMACSAIDTNYDVPVGATVDDLTVFFRASHTWVGDLTVKLRTPEGSVLALLERPQGDGEGNALGDNGADSPFGDSSDLSAAFPLSFNDSHPHDPEHMGLGIPSDQNVCEHDGRCQFFPNPDQALVVGNSVPNFGSLAGERATGEWALCMGDSAQSFVGTFESWTLQVDYTTPAIAVQASALPIVVRPLSDVIFANGFEGP